MKVYKLNKYDLRIIRESIKERRQLSIYFFMRKLKCTFDKAEYIFKKFIPRYRRLKMQIYKTIMYHLFKRLEGNRPIDERNLKNIIASMQKENRLQLHPIIVNEDYYILDGQHRFAAAKGLDLPIYYVVSKGKDEKQAYTHIMDANINQKKWTLEDYLNLYAKKDHNENYIEFINLMEMLDIKSKALCGLLFGNKSGSAFEKIKEGNFKLPDNKKQMEKICNTYLHLRDFVEERKIKPRSMFMTYHFCVAFRMLMMNETCDSITFFSKLENRWFDIKPQATIEGWFRCLIGIYNWKNSNKIELAA
jgi:hypothetical protein